VRDLDRAIIATTLLAHYRSFVIGFILKGQTPEDAETDAINAVRLLAKDAFPTLTLEILPEANQ